MSNRQGSFVDSVIIAARENPIAAALIGGGALWFLIGNEKLNSAASLATTTAFPSSSDTAARRQRSASSRYEATPAPPTAPEMDHEGSLGLGETLHHARTAASDAASKAADQMKDRFGGGDWRGIIVGQLDEILPGKETFTRAQSSLSDLLERQPLVLGAIGLAVGAAVAGAFRTSDLENEWVGEYSDSVKEDLSERAGDFVRRARAKLLTRL